MDIDLIAWLKKKRGRRQTARELYGSIVTQARQHIFYADWGIPDSTQGRVELILLHLVLVLQRLSREDRPGRQMARALTEQFVIDMDDAMREMTFGDLAVPREVKRATAALFDRHGAYLAALAGTHDMALGTAIETQMAYLAHGGCLDSASLADYMRKAEHALGRQPGVSILAGTLDWPQLSACGARRSVET